MKVNIELGDEVKDRMTGFTGKVECISYYLWGCTQMLVRGEWKGEEYPKAVWIDEPQLELTKDNGVEYVPRRYD